jgi:hypothetical protein
MTRQTFKTTHVPRGPRTDDSERLRRRLAQFFRSIEWASTGKAAQHTSMSMGHNLTDSNLPTFLEECTIVEFLEAVTHIYDGLPEDEYNDAYLSADAKESYPKAKWLSFITQAFEDENVAYRVLPDARVTYFVDELFEQARISSLEALDERGLETAQGHFEAALQALKHPDKSSLAISEFFKATENAFKVITGEAQLKEGNCQSALQRLVGPKTTAENTATNLMLTSFGKWIAAAHNYRHADDTEVPMPPSKELAVWMISTGMSHLRWMLSIRKN